MSSATAAVSSATAAVSSASTSPGPSAKLVELIPEKYKSRGEIVAALTYSPPFAYVDTSGNLTKGLLLDTFAEFEKRTGLKVKVTNQLVSAIQPGLEAGRFDVTAPLSDFTRRHATLDIVDTTLSKIAYLVPSGGQFQPKVVTDFCGRTIAAQAGGFSVTAIGFVSDVCTKAGLPEAKPLVLPDSAAEVLAVKSGRADASTDLSDVVNAQALASNGEMKMVIPEDVSKLAYGTTISGTAVSKSSGLGPLMLAFYQELAADGTYRDLYTKWGEQGAMLEPSLIKINGSQYQS